MSAGTTELELSAAVRHDETTVGMESRHCNGTNTAELALSRHAARRDDESGRDNRAAPLREDCVSVRHLGCACSERDKIARAKLTEWVIKGSFRDLIFYL